MAWRDVNMLLYQGGSLWGWGWWRDVCNLQYVCLLSAVIDRPSFLATVFYDASAFNRDLDQWDVSKVTDINES
jgi:surface protein